MIKGNFVLEITTEIKANYKRTNNLFAGVLKYGWDQVKKPGLKVKKGNL